MFSVTPTGSTPPPREERGNEAVYVAGTEAIKTGIIFTLFFTGIHYVGTNFLASSYKSIPPHLRRIVAAVGTLGAVWFQANAAYATAITEWHQQDAHIRSVNDENERLSKQNALRIVQQQKLKAASTAPPLK